MDRSPAEVLSSLQTRVRGSTKLHPTATGFSYSPIHGLTAVFALCAAQIEQIAAPLYEALRRIPEVKESLLLLPPASYHVTLRGLEAAMKTTTADELLKLQKSYETIFLLPSADETVPDSPATKHVKSLVAERTVEIVFDDPHFGEAAVFLVKPIGLLAEQLQMAQEATCAVLGLPAAVQQYHISVGYFITADYEKQRAAQATVLCELKKAMISAGMRTLNLDPCHVCWYESMEAFVPFFSNDV